MKRVLFTTAIAFSLIVGACNSNKGEGSNGGDSTNASSSSVDAKDAPIIKFDKNNYDFGKISEGEKVKHEFTFTNAGKSPLIITNATPSCGCTVPEFPHEPIPPGGKGVIKIVFDSKGKNGLQNKVVTVTSNAVPESTEIYLIGEVEAAEAK